MRPVLKFLSNELIDQIISEARVLLTKLGVEIQSNEVLKFLSSLGVKIYQSKSRAYISNTVIDRALAAVPKSFKLYDSNGEQSTDFSDNNIHFTPGSSALYLLDAKTNTMRKPNTKDYIRYVKVVDQLKYIASQSTALIPSDVTEEISDSYRLFLSLLYSNKPIVTGTFSIDSFELMKNMLLAVRGSEENLKENPLAMFTCCPTSPLKWTNEALQNIIECGKFSIPIEIVAMPLAGFISPITLVGTLIQHTAEVLSGIVISQLYNPGTPVLFGSSAAIFDMRYQTTPMGAIETMMIDGGLNEIGKSLDIPTQAYISLSDSKKLDMQSGIETGMGAVIGALSGINNMSGPGMIDFENCHSTEKLVMDNEICGMALRLAKGIEPKEDFPALPRFQELLQDNHLMISEHTLKHLASEHYIPGNSIDRTSDERWLADGSNSQEERLNSEVERMLQTYTGSALPREVQKDLIKLMENEARRYKQNRLPDRD